MERIIIVGTSGSGKTTLARTLANRINGSHIEIDALFHLPDWKETPDEEMLARLDELTNAERWTTCGNYRKFLIPIALPKADTIVWLDYNLAFVLARLLRRTFRRLLRREELWNGNRESWRMFFSRESIFLWALKSHYANRLVYSKLFAHETDRLIHLRSPLETKQWLNSITSDLD
jgi:adenylate kinase family enzyme